MRRAVVALVVIAAGLSAALASRALGQDVVVAPPPEVQVVEAPTQAPIVLVQPAYGYAYSNPQSAALHAELAQLELQISEYSLGGPIVVTSIGGGVFVIAASFWLLYSLADEISGDYSSERLTSGIAALAGGALFAAGMVWLFSNISGRRPYTTRRKQIILQLRAMGEQAYAPGLAPLFTF